MFLSFQKMPLVLSGRVNRVFYLGILDVHIMTFHLMHCYDDERMFFRACDRATVATTLTVSCGGIRMMNKCCDFYSSVESKARLSTFAENRTAYVNMYAETAE